MYIIVEGTLGAALCFAARPHQSSFPAATKAEVSPALRTGRWPASAGPWAGASSGQRGWSCCRLSSLASADHTHARKPVTGVEPWCFQSGLRAVVSRTPTSYSVACWCTGRFTDNGVCSSNC